MSFNYRVPVNELTSHANILRIAAEVKMDRPGMGCCNTFATIRHAICSHYDYSNSATMDRKLRQVNQAEAHFCSLMQGDSRNPYRNNAFWMGPLGRKGDARRITALLAAAETV